MTTPHDNSPDVSTRSTAELVRELLDTNHPDSYTLCSLDQSSMDNPYYRRELFHDRVCCFNHIFSLKQHFSVNRFFIYHCLMRKNQQVSLFYYGFVKKSHHFYLNPHPI